MHELATTVTTTRESAGSVLVTVSGDLDISTDDVFAESVAGAMALDSGEIVVELEACAFVSARSFTVLHAAADHCAARGQALRVRHPPATFEIMSALALRDAAPISDAPPPQRT